MWLELTIMVVATVVFSVMAIFSAGGLIYFIRKRTRYPEMMLVPLIGSIGLAIVHGRGIFLVINYYSQVS